MTQHAGNLAVKFRVQRQTEHGSTGKPTRKYLNKEGMTELAYHYFVITNESGHR